MRKILTIICVVLLFCLCGCSSKEITPLTNNISFTAHISYYNESYETNVSISKSGVFTMEITDPDILRGIKFIFADGSVKANYNGIEYAPNENNTQFFGVADKIHSVFDSIKGVTAKEDDGIYVIEGEINGDEFEIEFGGAGLPLNLKMYDNISVRFSNAKILKHTA